MNTCDNANKILSGVYLIIFVGIPSVPQLDFDFVAVIMLYISANDVGFMKIEQLFGGFNNW